MAGTSEHGVECVVRRPIWCGGAPQHPGAIVCLPRADAHYAASLGRVEIVVAPAPAGDEPQQPAAPRGSRRGRRNIPDTVTEQGR